MPEPRPYNMTNPEDRERWFREMKQYLSLAGEDNFLIQGTDRAGRKFAWDAFLSIEPEFRHEGSCQSYPNLKEIILNSFEEMLDSDQCPTTICPRQSPEKDRLGCVKCILDFMRK